MTLSELRALLDKSKLPKALYYSEGLRLRPNYLLYTLSSELEEDQKGFLLTKEIPWAEYTDCTALEALVAYLLSVKGGLYTPRLEQDLFEKKAKQCVFLLDPHLIDEFEESLTKKRRGVLIRRPLLASLNFKEAISLEELW